MRGVSAAFARLEKALDNTTRPVWGLSMTDPLAYLQAKFDRRVSDGASRAAAAMMIDEWRQRALAEEPKSDPDRPIEEWTDGELAAALSIRRYGQPIAKPEAPRPPKPARMRRKPTKTPRPPMRNSALCAERSGDRGVARSSHRLLGCFRGRVQASLGRRLSCGNAPTVRRWLPLRRENRIVEVRQQCAVSRHFLYTSSLTCTRAPARPINGGQFSV